MFIFFYFNFSSLYKAHFFPKALTRPVVNTHYTNCPCLQTVQKQFRTYCIHEHHSHCHNNNISLRDKSFPFLIMSIIRNCIIKYRLSYIYLRMPKFNHFYIPCLTFFIRRIIKNINLFTVIP